MVGFVSACLRLSRLSACLSVGLSVGRSRVPQNSKVFFLNLSLCEVRRKHQQSLFPKLPVPSHWLPGAFSCQRSWKWARVRVHERAFRGRYKVRLLRLPIKHLTTSISSHHQSWDTATIHVCVLLNLVRYCRAHSAGLGLTLTSFIHTQPSRPIQDLWNRGQTFPTAPRLFEFRYYDVTVQSCFSSHACVMNDRTPGHICIKSCHSPMMSLPLFLDHNSIFHHVYNHRSSPFFYFLEGIGNICFPRYIWPIGKKLGYMF